jgi:hypothetical protein
MGVVSVEIVNTRQSCYFSNIVIIIINGSDTGLARHAQEGQWVQCTLSKLPYTDGFKHDRTFNVSQSGHSVESGKMDF